MTLAEVFQPARRRRLQLAAAVAAAAYLVWFWYFILLTGDHVDARAYWSVDPANPYAESMAGAEGAFLYSPAIAQLLAPATQLPESVFIGLLLAASICCLVYMLGWWSALILLIPAAPLVQELRSGNIHLIMAAAIVVGFRYPAAWAFVLLTKVTPGVGLLWFAVRREWRALGVALAVTLLVSGVSYLAAPETWAQWWQVLTSNTEAGPSGLYVAIPLGVRVALAAVIVTWGALNDHRWTVPLAATVALPIIWYYNGFAMLAGVAAILMRDRTGRQGD